jgi:acetyl-CoA synthetase
MGKEITAFDYEKERAKFIRDIPEDYNFVDTIRIENVVDSHKAVLESAMVPSPDIIRGEIVKVFVVLKEGYESSEELVKELPKTISGKIKRKELRIMEFEKKKDVIEKLKEKGLWHR